MVPYQIQRILDFPRKVKYGIINLIRWFPVIWKDRNWDHYFIYEVLHFKLSQTEKYLRKYGHHLNAERDAYNIQVCVNLLKRLMDDDYGEMVFKPHDKKWGKAKFNWDDCEDKPGYCSLRIERPDVKTEEDKIQERKEFRLLSKHEEQLKQQDLDYLFKMMRKHIQSWWD